MHRTFRSASVQNRAEDERLQTHNLLISVFWFLCSASHRSHTSSGETIPRKWNQQRKSLFLSSGFLHYLLPIRVRNFQHVAKLVRMTTATVEIKGVLQHSLKHRHPLPHGNDLKMSTEETQFLSEKLFFNNPVKRFLATSLSETHVQNAAVLFSQMSAALVPLFDRMKEQNVLSNCTPPFSFCEVSLFHL